MQVVLDRPPRTISPDLLMQTMVQHRAGKDAPVLETHRIPGVRRETAVVAIETTTRKVDRRIEDGPMILMMISGTELAPVIELLNLLASLPRRWIT